MCEHWVLWLLLHREVMMAFALRIDSLAIFSFSPSVHL